MVTAILLRLSIIQFDKAAAKEKARKLRTRADDPKEFRQENRKQDYTAIIIKACCIYSFFFSFFFFGLNLCYIYRGFAGYKIIVDEWYSCAIMSDRYM